MQREHIEKLNSSPAWKAEFENALAQAEALHGKGHADAIAYATKAADLATDPEAIAGAAAADKARAETARIEALVAEARTRPMPAADAGPGPAERVKAGWARAFGTDAGTAQPEASAEAAKEKPAEPARATSGWAKAFGTGGGE